MAQRLSWLVAAVLAIFCPGALANGHMRGSKLLHQILVFDAGSSGTRIHIFDLYSQTNQQRHVPQVDLSVRGQQTKKVKPGLSSFAANNDVEGAQKNILELLKFADQFVEPDVRHRTAVVLKATAGLRAADPVKAEAILEGIRKTFEASSYRFRPEWASIIAGKEEGGLAWVAANYLAGRFADRDTAPAATPSLGAYSTKALKAMAAWAASNGTLGVIEMGGGSTQVSFEVGEDEEVAESDEFIFVTGRGKRYRVYAHSYLGYGQDAARMRLKAALPPGEFEDPCYPPGYTRTAPLAANAEVATITGTGKFDVCQTTVEDRLFQSQDEAPGHYAKEQPLRPGQYIATENFFYSQNDLVLHFEDNPIDLENYKGANQVACQKAVASPEDKLADYCFAFSYQIKLLQTLDAFRAGIDAKIVHQVNNSDVDWALGAALVLYLEGRSANLSKEEATASSALLGALIAAAAVLMLAVGLWNRGFRGAFAKPAAYGDVSPTKYGGPAE